jgi:hypothetical protein
MPIGRCFRAAVALLVTIAVGMASRKLVAPIPYWLKEVGDVLWAVAAYWAIALIWPRGRWQGIAAIALAAAWASELSQLSDAPWLAAGRKMPILKMLLGSGFSWVDMGMYVVGVALAVLLDRTFFHAGAERYAAPPRIRAGADYRSGPA